MKIKAFTLLAACVALFAFKTIDVLSQLGTATTDANAYFFDALTTNNASFSADIVTKARSLPADVRADCARQLVRLAKAYTKTEAFEEDYKNYRRKNVVSKARGFRLPSASSLLSKAAGKMLSGDEGNDTSLPADASELVKRRLEHFMKVTATVDFDAKLNGSHFADTEYERKSNQWKMYYRCGKPVVDAARAEVQAWLDELK